MKYLAIILSLCVFAGCAKKQYPQFLLTKVKDTTITKVEYRDTVIRIPAKQVDVTKYLPGDCPDFDTTVKKGNTTINVSKKGNQLNVACKEDSLRLIIAGLNKEIFTLRGVTNEVPVPVYQDKPYIPKWIWYALGIFAALAAWGNRKTIVNLFKLIAGLWT